MDAITARPAVSLAVFDRAALLDRVDGDDALLGAVVEVFLDDVPHVMRAIERALDRVDPGALRAGAHALKGAAANISADALCAAADALEHLAHGGPPPPAAAGVVAVRTALAELRSVLERSLHDGGAPSR